MICRNCLRLYLVITLKVITKYGVEIDCAVLDYHFESGYQVRGRGKSKKNDFQKILLRIVFFRELFEEQIWLS